MHFLRFSTEKLILCATKKKVSCDHLKIRSLVITRRLAGTDTGRLTCSVLERGSGRHQQLGTLSVAIQPAEARPQCYTTERNGWHPTMSSYRSCEPRSVQPSPAAEQFSESPSPHAAHSARIARPLLAPQVTAVGCRAVIYTVQHT